MLGGIEDEYDVQRRFLVAIWGMETRYGRVTGNTPIFQALATLAWEPRRAAFFRGQLFDALTMVSSGYIDAPSMTGSWAGAMGQPQFMPSSYLKYAVDFDGDGRRDIWRSTPDALASIANYLRGGAGTTSSPGAAKCGSRARRARRIADAPAADRRLLRDAQHDRAPPARRVAALGVRLTNGGPLPRATGGRARETETAASWSTPTTTPSCATTARTTTRSPSRCSPIRSDSRRRQFVVRGTNMS